MICGGRRLDGGEPQSLPECRYEVLSDECTAKVRAVQPPRLIKLPEPLKDLPTAGGGFYFIATVLDVEIALPIEITPFIHFDRADPSQIELIQQSLYSLEDYGMNIRRMYYEHDWLPNDNMDKTKGYRSEPITEKRCRYYILSFSGFGHDVNDLLKIMFLVPPYISAFAHFRTTLPFGCGSFFGRGLDRRRANRSIRAPSSLNLLP
jgi:hypothetical protein